MIEQLFELNQKSFVCHDCNMMMTTTNEIVEYPLIACVSFTGDKVLRDLEKRMHIRSTHYDLLCVIYHDSHHYKCRFNIANIAYEYDGMIQGGNLRKVLGDSTFPGTTYNARQQPSMVAQVAYYIKSSL